MSSDQVTVVNADYSVVGVIENVLFYFPSPENDKYVKHIESHEISIPDGSKVAVPAHFRRGYLVDGKIVTGNIFLDQNNQGKKVLTQITVVVKNDHHRNQRSLILDIRPAAADQRPDYLLKIGVPDNGTSDNMFLIPGTNKKNLQFLKINKN